MTEGIENITTLADTSDALYWAIQRAFLSIMGLTLSTVGDDPLDGKIPKEATRNGVSISVLSDDKSFRVCLHPNGCGEMKRALIERIQYQISVPNRDLLHWDPSKLALSIVSEIKQGFMDLETIDCA